MYLVEAKDPVSLLSDEGPAPTRLASEPWHDFPYSRLSHHGTACCDVARDWVLTMDFAQLNGAALLSGPRWLRSKYKWGPSTWPMHWCEAVRRKTIDCGAHAALSREMFVARGMTAFPAQVVQRYSEQAVDQWRCQWMSEDASCHWLDRDHIYHEATALLTDEAGAGIKIWDASSATWLDPHGSVIGYGSVVAVRISAGGDYQDGLKWGDRNLGSDVWNQLT
jgi:hypothetical protein